MPGERTEKVGLSPSERAKQDRRIARAIQGGLPMRRLMEAYHITEARVNEVASTFKLEVKSGVGAGRRW